MGRRISIHSYFIGLLALLLSACVGGGGGGGGPAGPLGGPVGAPAPGGIADFGGSPAVPGESVVALGSPEMPDVPVAPQLDVEDLEDKPRPVEFRVEGKILSACQMSNGPQIRKKIAAQLSCRWQGSDDEFTICGKGRFIKALDAITHYYVDAQTSESESRFEIDFIFNPGPSQAGRKSFSDSHQLLLAKYIPGNQNHVSDSLESGHMQNTGKYNVGSGEDDGYEPLDFGDNNDEADKNIPSDESDLIFYARASHLAPPFELGVQKWCSLKDWCQPGPHGSHIHLGPLHLVDLAFTADDLPDPLPACP